MSGGRSKGLHTKVGGASGHWESGRDQLGNLGAVRHGLDGAGSHKRMDVVQGAYEAGNVVEEALGL